MHYGSLASSPRAWFNLYVITGAHFGLIALLYAFLGQNAQLPPTPGGNIILFGVIFMNLGPLVGLAAWLHWKKVNEHGQRVLMPFGRFQSLVLVLAAMCEFNALVGIFLGRGYEVFVGLGFAVLGLLGGVVPVLVKMRPLYKLTEATPN